MVIIVIIIIIIILIIMISWKYALFDTSFAENNCKLTAVLFVRDLYLPYNLLCFFW